MKSGIKILLMLLLLATTATADYNVAFGKTVTRSATGTWTGSVGYPTYLENIVDDSFTTRTSSAWPDTDARTSQPATNASYIEINLGAQYNLSTINFKFYIYNADTGAGDSVIDIYGGDNNGNYQFIYNYTISGQTTTTQFTAKLLSRSKFK